MTSRIKVTKEPGDWAQRIEGDDAVAGLNMFKSPVASEVDCQMSKLICGRNGTPTKA